MFALSIVHGALFFVLIAGLAVLITLRRRIMSPTAETFSMKRASKLALGVLAAIPAAGLISYFLGVFSARVVYSMFDAPAIFWETIGLFLLATGVPLALFIAAREVIYLIGGKRS